MYVVIVPPKSIVNEKAIGAAMDWKWLGASGSASIDPNIPNSAIAAREN